MISVTKNLGEIRSSQKRQGLRLNILLNDVNARSNGDSNTLLRTTTSIIKIFFDFFKVFANISCQSKPHGNLQAKYNII